MLHTLDQIFTLSHTSLLHYSHLNTGFLNAETMVVLRRTTGGSYLLAELDGAVSRLRYAAFRLIPYYSRLSSIIRITELTDTDDENLDKLAGEDVEEPDEEDRDSYESD